MHYRSVVLLFLLLQGLPGLVLGSVAPNYVWPLGNETAVLEVMNGHDGIMPESQNCFEYADGYPELPYRSLRMNGKPSSYIDISLNGTVDFKDLVISFYLYPEDSMDSTLVHYLYDTGNILRISIMEEILFISFWDEYGVSVGATALPDVLVQDSWNHLLVSREFSTGTIGIYHNGVLMEQLDDDFPNNIQLPTSGHLRLGRSHDKSDDGFMGRMTCFQLFDTILNDTDMSAILSFCQPNNWMLKPKLEYEEKLVDGVIKQCLTNLPDPAKTKEPPCSELISQRCLTNSASWDQLADVNAWNESSANAAYFSLVSLDSKPSDSDGHIIGNVMTSHRRVCSRLCMRIASCRSYVIYKSDSQVTKCLLYDDVRPAEQPDAGAKYFAMRV